jgi:hypothetical protein
VPLDPVRLGECAGGRRDIAGERSGDGLLRDRDSEDDLPTDLGRGPGGGGRLGGGPDLAPHAQRDRPSERRLRIEHRKEPHRLARRRDRPRHPAGDECDDPLGELVRHPQRRPAATRCGRGGLRRVEALPRVGLAAHRSDGRGHRRAVQPRRLVDGRVDELVVEGHPARRDLAAGGEQARRQRQQDVPVGCRQPGRGLL